MLNVGDKVFVPSYGAGYIDKIETREIQGGVTSYTNISILTDNIYLYIPISRLDDYNIRLISDKTRMENALSIIKEEPLFIEKKWSQRYRKNNDKISSGDVVKLCEVLRDLFYLKRKEMIPPGEKKILEKAIEMLKGEVSLVFDISLEAAKGKISAYNE
jgi:CarD family transcriptional regulator